MYGFGGLWKMFSVLCWEFWWLIVVLGKMCVVFDEWSGIVVSIDVLIVGVGVVGLMCVMMVVGCGCCVWVFDYVNKVGKKIFMFGGGCCNFINLYIELVNFFLCNLYFCKLVLVCYIQWDFIGLVVKYQVLYYEKKFGQLFCDNKFSDIFEMLLCECVEVGVEILLDILIEEIVCDDVGYYLCISVGEMCCELLVIVSGGLLILIFGVSGFGYQVVCQFGYEVLLICVGLVLFIIIDQLKELCVEFFGIFVDCWVSCNG